MYYVIEQGSFFFLLSYSNDLTFVWFEGHKPFTFPGHKFCEVCLQGLTVYLV